MSSSVVFLSDVFLLSLKLSTMLTPHSVLSSRPDPVCCRSVNWSVLSCCPPGRLPSGLKTQGIPSSLYICPWGLLYDRFVPQTHSSIVAPSMLISFRAPWAPWRMTQKGTDYGKPVAQLSLTSDGCYGAYGSRLTGGGQGLSRHDIRSEATLI